MSATSYFNKPCPACGRMSRVAISYLGKQVRCKHCGREFTAEDPHNESAAVHDPVSYWVNFTQKAQDNRFGEFQSNRFPR